MIAVLLFYNPKRIFWPEKTKDILSDLTLGHQHSMLSSLNIGQQFLQYFHTVVTVRIGLKTQFQWEHPFHIIIPSWSLSVVSIRLHFDTLLTNMIRRRIHKFYYNIRSISSGHLDIRTSEHLNQSIFNESPMIQLDKHKIWHDWLIFQQCKSNFTMKKIF